MEVREGVLEDESTFMVRKLAELTQAGGASPQELAEKLLALAARPPFDGAEVEPSFLQVRPAALGCSV